MFSLSSAEPSCKPGTLTARLGSVQAAHGCGRPIGHTMWALKHTAPCTVLGTQRSRSTSQLHAISVTPRCQRPARRGLPPAVRSTSAWQVLEQGQNEHEVGTQPAAHAASAHEAATQVPTSTQLEPPTTSPSKPSASTWQPGAVQPPRGLLFSVPGTSPQLARAPGTNGSGALRPAYTASPQDIALPSTSGRAATPILYDQRPQLQAKPGRDAPTAAARGAATKSRKLRAGTFEDVGGVAAVYSSSQVASQALAGPAAPPPLKHFGCLRAPPYRFPDFLLHNMQRLRLGAPTPVQAHAIPAITSGRDLLATSETGSGKTAAFLLPVLGAVGRREAKRGPNNRAYPIAVLLAPTRELVLQTLEVVKALLRGSHVKAAGMHGGESVAEVAMALRGGADVVVATPGRLLDMVEKRGVVKLEQLRYLVVDEADKLLDLGFEPELRRLVAHKTMPPRDVRQTVMFACTLAPELHALASDFLRPDAVALNVGHASGAASLVSQSVALVPPAERMTRLVADVTQGVDEEMVAGLTGYVPERLKPGGLTVVFTNTISRAREVHQQLVQRAGVGASLLHSSLPQVAREEAVQCFRYGVTPVLVATGVAARGLDVPDVSRVINYDCPHDIGEYVHRVGRTGRGGRPGRATTYMSAADSKVAPELAEVLQALGQPVPAWLGGLAQTAVMERAAGLTSSSSGSEEETEEVGSDSDMTATRVRALRVAREKRLALGGQGGAGQAGAAVRKGGVSKAAGKRGAGSPAWGAFVPDTAAAQVPASTAGAKKAGSSAQARDMDVPGGAAVATGREASGRQALSDEDILKQWHSVITARPGQLRAGARSRGPGSVKTSSTAAAAVQAHTALPGQDVDQAQVHAVGEHAAAQGGNDSELQPAPVPEAVKEGQGGSSEWRGARSPPKQKTATAVPKASARSQRLFDAF